jgi:hypothetical protein
MLSNGKRQIMRKLVLLSFLFSGCYYHQSAEPVIPSDQSYLPLEIGNSWDFQPLGSLSGASIHREVFDVLTSQSMGHTYYLLVTHSTVPPPGLPIRPDSAYYRIDDNGFVYILRTDRAYTEDNRLRLNAKNGDTWTYPVDDTSNAKITVTSGSLEIGNTQIANCKSYYFDVLNWADEENTITLAPGIGFVKEYSDAWGYGQILKSAKIHGRIYNF